nr:MAG TPA: hypothetical protein [Caudoviricetes sp.]
MRLLNIDRSKTPVFRSKPLNLVPMGLKRCLNAILIPSGLSLLKTEE